MRKEKIKIESERGERKKKDKFIFILRCDTNLKI